MKPTVLVMDRDESTRTVLKTCLHRRKFRAILTDNREAALLEISHAHPDAILLGLTLPEMAELELCWTLKHTPQTAKTIVCVMAPAIAKDVLISTQAAGADFFFPKPVDEEEICRQLHTTLVGQNSALKSIEDATINGWARAMQLRDGETEEHNERVAELTVRLARKLGVPEDEIVHIRHGALLHDIGKIGIPDAILHKPGPLTDDERAEMKKHPELARQMLEGLDFLKPAISIPYCHHEKWDGTGYPQRLAGENIPLQARIFTLADVYDALVVDRPYRKAWPWEQAIAYIESEAGKQFDPRLVPIFVKMIRKDHQLAVQYRPQPVAVA
jgi:uncharacterized domain HDIG